jgi:hypothetical protein
MFLFPFDAHLVALVVAGMWIAHWRKEHATVRRLNRLVKRDRQLRREELGL